MAKEPNAVCMWCSDNYEPKDFFCVRHQAIIQDPDKPRRCVDYTGERVTEFNLKYLIRIRKARERERMKIS